MARCESNTPLFAASPGNIASLTTSSQAMSKQNKQKIACLPFCSISHMVKSPKCLHVLVLSKSMDLVGTITEEEWLLFHSSVG